MVALEFRLVGKRRQYAALDEGIRTTQFIRNKCVRYWQDTRDVTPYDLNKYCTVLACAYDFVRKLNAMARQAAAERAGAAITRFYKNCRQKKPGKKGYPRFQKNGRSVEYKTTGWKLNLALLAQPIVGHDGKSRLGREEPLQATGNHDLQARSLNQDSHVL
jgi:putative transposase